MRPGLARPARKKKVANDADRIRKYLASHGLTWAEVCGPPVE